MRGYIPQLLNDRDIGPRRKTSMSNCEMMNINATALSPYLSTCKSLSVVVCACECARENRDSVCVCECARER